MKTTRKVTAIAVGLLLLVISPAGASATATVIPTLDPIRDLTAGPDGAMWGIEQHSPSYGAAPTDVAATWVVRLDEGGIRTRALLPSDAWPFDSNGVPHPLPGGGMGVVALQRHWEGSTLHTTGATFMRFAPGTGALEDTTILPAAATSAAGFAIAADGAIWFARSCQDKLERVSADGAVTRVVHLPRLGCGSSSDARERGAGLAFDVSGALWLVNRCMGRVDRVSISGRVTEWWTPPVWCSSDPYEAPQTTPAGIAVDPRGGISFDTTPMGGFPAAPRRHGRGGRFPSRGAGVFTPDGALWSLPATGGVQRTQRDTVATLHGPMWRGLISNLAVTRTGVIAMVLGSFWKSFDPQVRDSVSTPVYLHPHLAKIAPDGSVNVGVALPDGGPEAATALSKARIVLGPDGAQWLNESRAAFDPSDQGTFRFAARIVRVLPAATAAPRPAIARVRHVARVGRALWLRLSCGAELARFCSGTARLAQAALVDGPTPYTIPGSLSGAVRLRLSDRAAFVLRRHGLTVTVIVRTKDGSETRQPVRLDAIGSKRVGVRK